MKVTFICICVPFGFDISVLFFFKFRAGSFSVFSENSRARTGLFDCSTEPAGTKCTLAKKCQILTISCINYDAYILKQLWTLFSKEIRNPKSIFFRTLAISCIDCRHFTFNKLSKYKKAQTTLTHCIAIDILCNRRKNFTSSILIFFGQSAWLLSTVYLRTVMRIWQLVTEIPKKTHNQ